MKMRDVAEHARVSVSTVSNAVNHPERVSPDILRRVHASIEQLNFVRNDAARQLRHGFSRTVGFVMLDGKNPFFMDVARGAEDRAAEAGLALTFGDSARNPGRELSYLDLFEEQRVRGVVISAYGDVIHRLQQLRERGIASVLINRRSSDESISSVSVDDVAGGRMAVEHLIAQGRRRIAFAGAEDTIQFTDRLAGARIAVMAHDDVSFEVVRVNAPHVTDGRSIALAIAERDPAERPDGVFASNDVVAMGMLQGFAHAPLQIRVPEEIALIGYDDIAYADMAAVPLSSIRHPAEVIGATAVSILLEEAARPEMPRRQVVFQPELVVRSSTNGHTAA